MNEIKTWQNHSGQLLDSVKGFDVIECETCGFKHIVPIPTQDELISYYKTEFVGKRPQLINKIKEDLDWWKAVYEEKYDYFERFFPKRGRKLLDIGCGLGYFLKEGKDRGWNVMGIEPSEQSVRHARNLGLEVINGTIYDDEVKIFSEFHVVHMHEVLEHLPDPVEAVGRCYDFLVTGGLLCSIVPNDYNILQNMLKNSMGYNPWWVSPPEHINYFNAASLQRLLEAKGFEVLLKTTTFPMEVFLLMGENYVGNNRMGKKCHSRRKNLELNLLKGGLRRLKKEIYEIFAEKGIGREIMFIARKKA